MSAPVTVTKPTKRGSFARSVRKVAISSRTASATRSARLPLRRGGRRERTSYLFLSIALDHVADLEIIEVLDTDTALESFANFANVVLEASERADDTVVDLDAIPDYTHASLAID